jgi:L-amino acid N-acyltransferase YncA
LSFTNKAFLGFVVDGNYRGCGIGGEMIKSMVQACTAAKIALYSSVSDHNQASMKAHLNNGFRKLRESNNGYWDLKYGENK